MGSRMLLVGSRMVLLGSRVSWFMWSAFDNCFQLQDTTNLAVLRMWLVPKIGGPAMWDPVILGPY